MKKINCVFVLVSILTAIFTGCASKPKLAGKGELCGIVIDENNIPVKDYVISCKIDSGLWKHAMTNDEGLFFFDEMPFGYYSFKGSKECYSNLYEDGLVFNSPGKVYCFQISSIDKALELAEEVILYQDYEQALLILGNIKCEKNKAAESVVSYYKKFVYKKMEEMNEEA